jgi:DNA-binding XRE family transcriptional regulator
MSKKDKRQLASQSHEEMVAQWMTDPKFKAEYDALEDEYKLLHDMLEARKRSGLTQADVAEKMGTKAPAIARLEATSGLDRHSPSINTLRKYARAVGCKLEIRLKPVINKTTEERRHSS